MGAETAVSNTVNADATTNALPSPFTFWLTTQVIDYIAIVMWACFFNWTLLLDMRPQFMFFIHFYVTSAWATGRDMLYVKLFPHPHLISKNKLETRAASSHLLWSAFKSTSLGVLIPQALHQVGVLDIDTKFDSVKSIGRICLDYFLLQLILDSAMEMFHSWFHRSLWAYKNLHAHHHKSRKDCSSIHAYEFDLIDLFMEFGLSPLLIVPVKYAMGLHLSVCQASVTLYGLSEIILHSNNPHTVYFFNPILDCLFKPTIYHALHHVIPNSRFGMGFQIGSYSWKNRAKEIDTYQESFGVDLGYPNILPPKPKQERKEE